VGQLESYRGRQERGEDKSGTYHVLEHAADFLHGSLVVFPDCLDYLEKRLSPKLSLWRKGLVNKRTSSSGFSSRQTRRRGGGDGSRRRRGDWRLRQQGEDAFVELGEDMGGYQQPNAFVEIRTLRKRNREAWRPLSNHRSEAIRAEEMVKDLLSEAEVVAVAIVLFVRWFQSRCLEDELDGRRKPLELLWKGDVLIKRV
jgi:hypothetical protein